MLQMLDFLFFAPVCTVKIFSIHNKIGWNRLDMTEAMINNRTGFIVNIGNLRVSKNLMYYLYRDINVLQHLPA